MEKGDGRCPGEGRNGYHRSPNATPDRPHEGRFGPSVTDSPTRQSTRPGIARSGFNAGVISPAGYLLRYA